MSVILDLQEWYKAQCNEDWEHQYGVNIGTLDNPGWTVEIDLVETKLAGKPFPARENLEPELHWIKCWVEDEKFHGVGGPEKLEEILQTFIQWARS